MFNCVAGKNRQRQLKPADTQLSCYSRNLTHHIGPHNIALTDDDGDYDRTDLYSVSSDYDQSKEIIEISGYRMKASRQTLIREKCGFKSW